MTLTRQCAADYQSMQERFIPAGRWDRLCSMLCQQAGMATSDRAVQPRATQINWARSRYGGHLGLIPTRMSWEALLLRWLWYGRC